MLYSTFPRPKCVILVLTWRTFWKILTLAYFFFLLVDLSCKVVLLMIPLLSIMEKIKWMSKLLFLYFPFQFSSTTLLSKLCMGNKKVSERHWWRLWLLLSLLLLVNAYVQLSSWVWVRVLDFWTCLIHCCLCVVTHKSFPFIIKFLMYCFCVMPASKESLNESSALCMGDSTCKKKSCLSSFTPPRLLQATAKCTDENTGSFHAYDAYFLCLTLQLWRVNSLFTVLFSNRIPVFWGNKTLSTFIYGHVNYQGYNYLKRRLKAS